MSRGDYSDDYDRGRGRDDDDHGRGRDDDYDRDRGRDDDYEGRRRFRRRGGMDDFFLNQMVLLVFLAICCNGIALILGIIGLCTCKDPQARSNAVIITVISAIITGLGVFFQLAMHSARF